MWTTTIYCLRKLSKSKQAKGNCTSNPSQNPSHITCLSQFFGSFLLSWLRWWLWDHLSLSRLSSSSRWLLEYQVELWTKDSFGTLGTDNWWTVWPFLHTPNSRAKTTSWSQKLSCSVFSHNVPGWKIHKFFHLILAQLVSNWCKNRRICLCPPKLTHVHPGPHSNCWPKPFFGC